MSEHSHGRKHSKAYYKYRKTKHKIKKAFKNNKLLLPLIVLIIACVSLSVGYAVSHNRRYSKNEDTTAVASVTSVDTVSRLNVFFPHFSEPQVLSASCVQDYMSNFAVTPVFEFISKNKPSERLDVSQPVNIKYDIVNPSSDLTVNAARVIISEKKSLNPAQTYNFDAGSSSIDIYNLKIASQYYYKITVSFTDSSEVSSSGSFYTAMTPRILSLDGTVNVRDIGGWKTSDGKTIKQGMILRGAEIDGLIVPEYKLTEKGISQFRDYFNIKLDADLRHTNEVKTSASYAGEDIKHTVYGIKAYRLYITGNENDPMKKLFSSLANRNNYPIYMHCTYGIDRTGTACYILEALLGMPEEKLLREYELSTLCFTENNARAEDAKVTAFIENFNSIEGNNPRKKAENYLLSIGVTKDEIESIRNILIE